MSKDTTLMELYQIKIVGVTVETYVLPFSTCAKRKISVLLDRSRGVTDHDSLTS